MGNDGTPVRLSYEALLELKRWNTPSVYNGWEAFTKKDRAKGHFNLEETRDFMPQMGPMVGYAVTVVIEPSNPSHPKANPNAWSEYRRYIAAAPGPKIVIVQDLDKPNFVGAYWGEVNSNIHRALGCVGSIIDGVIRDVDDMDANECRTLIPAARASAGKTMEEILREMDEAGRRFGEAVKKKFGAKGEG